MSEVRCSFHYEHCPACGSGRRNTRGLLPSEDGKEIIDECQSDWHDADAPRHFPKPERSSE